MQLESRQITLADDLHELAAAINQSSWDGANEMSAYDPDALAAYLKREDTVFVACHDVSVTPPTLMGIASSRIEMKPYARQLWLYVDEVDVCADQRQRGAGKHLMRALINIAQDAGCEELWLGTEVDNQPANALYRALDPDDVADVVGYTYETDND